MELKNLPISQLMVGVALLLVAGYNFYHLTNLSGELVVSDANLASSTAHLRILEQELAEEQGRSAGLASSLQSEKERNDNFASQMEDISDTVGVLEKIKNTDPQLLEKYSKVYFLNENYIPSKLSYIDKAYWYDQNKPQFFHAGALDHLEKMLAGAESDGVNLRISSAYRSFDTQAAVKAAHVMTYGTGANIFSADQGYSEHQLGTTVDLILPTLTSLETTFANTEAYQWLAANAYKYGFILSYPKGNTYYQYEPWHWRFVGLQLAKYLHKEGKNFYDLEQRDIDKYRADFFD